MKVIACLGKLNERHTALILDNKYFPYYIVNGWNGEFEGDDLWVNTVKYYDNIFDFAKAITGYKGIGWHRMSEIASLAIDGLIEDGMYEAKEYFRESIELEPEEAEYFGIEDLYEED